MRGLPEWVRPWVALALVVMIAVAPFVRGLFWAPVGADAIVLMLDGSLDNPDWVEWVFLQKHWIGYRPMFALSFLLTDLVGGQVWMHNLANLVIYAGFLIAVFLAFRRLEGDRGWFAVVAVALVSVHPASTSAVFVHANRSYPMASGFALGSVVLLLDDRSRWKPWAAGAMLGLALFSNETAYLFVLLGPLALWMTAKDGLGLRAVAPRLMAFLAPVPLALALRYQVIGGLGGYPSTQVGSHLGNVSAPGAHPWMAVQGALAFLVAPENPVIKRKTLVLAGLGAAVVALWIAWRTARSPRSAGAWGVAWALLTVVLAAATHTWFPRMGLGMAVAMGFTGASALRELAHADGGPRRWLAGLPVALLLLILVPNSAFSSRIRPRASDYGRYAAAFGQVEDRVERPATIYLASHQPMVEARQLPRWLAAVRRGDDLRFELLVARIRAAGVEILRDQRKVAVGRAPRGPAAAGIFDGRELDLAKLPVPGRHSYLFWMEDGEPQLLPLDSGTDELSSDEAREAPG